MPEIIADVWVLLPLLGFILYWFLNIFKGGKARIAYCKYNPYIPFWFRYKPKPIRNDKRINIAEIHNKIKKGDILLRKYRYYIDEFIFSANSYFTHVGIYDGKSSVLHCTSLDNVHETLLDDFCDGDDIAVLRFSFNKSPEEEKIYGYVINPEYKTDAGKANDAELRQKEEAVFSKLMQNEKPELFYGLKEKIGHQREVYPDIDVVVDRARSLIGKPYDLKFDFEDFSKFSCIEYVWYCFKCLFPLHRIRVKDFEFFDLVVMPIIDPDVFIRNDFFDVIYSSVPGVDTKDLLIKKIKKRRWTFASFIVSIVLWDVIPMTLFCVYYCYFVKGG